MPKNIEWVGSLPQECNLCHKKLENFFVDGKLLHGGQWAVMCVLCHTLRGVGLGMGLGQKFCMKTRKKVEG